MPGMETQSGCGNSLGQSRFLRNTAYRNLIRNIGAAGFAPAESIGDIKRIVLGYLISH